MGKVYGTYFNRLYKEIITFVSNLYMIREVFPEFKFVFEGDTDFRFSSPLSTALSIISKTLHQSYWLNCCHATMFHKKPRFKMVRQVLITFWSKTNTFRFYSWIPNYRCKDRGAPAGCHGVHHLYSKHWSTARSAVHTAITHQPAFHHPFHTEMRRRSEQYIMRWPCPKKFRWSLSVC